MNDYLLQEDGFRIDLEDDSGSILLERISAPASICTEGDSSPSAVCGTIQSGSAVCGSTR